MFIIEVIPLARGSNLETLSYYSSTAYKSGTLIDVPIRNKSTRALVVNSSTVSTAKTAIRAATFRLKKLANDINPSPLPPLLIQCARELVQQTPATLGAILYALLPEEVKNGEVILDPGLPCHSSDNASEVSILTANREERVSTYRSTIREAFAHRGSVLLLVPTSKVAEKMFEALSNGINERVLLLTGNTTTKKRQAAWQGLQDLSQSKLIITTMSHLAIDRPDLTHIIIEEAHSPHYVARTRPYLDAREVAKVLAKLSNRKLLLGDLTPRVEDEYWRRADIYATEAEHPKRLALPGNLRVIKQKDRPTAEEPFRIFSKGLMTALEDTVSSRRQAFLLCGRRGLSPVVACGDCGHVFRCPDSGTPYSLFRTTKDGEEKRWFLSGTSGRRVRAADTCPDCGSWRLRERGIGIQQVYDELLKTLPADRIFLFDHTTANTPRKARQIISGFYDKKGAVLLGTTMALPHIEKPVEIAGITSLDAIRSTPTWKVDEETFSLLLYLRELTRDTLFVQTRQESDDMLVAARTGSLDSFYDSELESREALRYPPFFKFIHLTIQGPVDRLKPLEVELINYLQDFSPTFYSAPDSTPNKFTRYCLIRLPIDKWPNKDLLDKLRQLPPHVRIELDPARIV